jgi:uncharacterized protein YdcH (DUF465 family)
MDRFAARSPDDDALLDRLRTEHRALEARLAELEHHLYLSADEQVERARLKKMKLAKKDQILSLGRQRTEITRA